MDLISDLGGNVFMCALWALLGGVVGAIGGGVVFALLRNLGAYPLAGKRGTFTRAGVAIAAVLTGGTAGCIFGSGHGLVRETRQALSYGPAQPLLMLAGGLGADLLAVVYRSVEKPIDPNSGGLALVMTELEAFEAGSWRFDVPALGQRMAHITDPVVAETAEALQARLYTRYPDLDGPRLRWLAKAVVTPVGQLLVRSQVADEAERRGFTALYEDLEDYARRHGKDGTLDRQQLSGFVVQAALIPALVFPVKLVAVQLDIAAAIVAVVGFGSPVVILVSLDWWRRRKAKKPAEVPQPTP